MLLAGPTGSSPDALGVVFALVAGAFWASCILISRRVGQDFEGGRGLALAMAVAAALMVAPGIAEGGARPDRPRVIGVGSPWRC